MVSSIAARGNSSAAANYYIHLKDEPYYLNSHSPKGEWFGYGAKTLDLGRIVRPEAFTLLLSGIHPQTHEKLVSLGGRKKTHTSGWDLTFSAPKSVSILWALSNREQREKVLLAHQNAVRTSLTHAEKNNTICRRGKGGKLKESVAGIVAATFQHFTSRALDPQLHTHCYVFNIAVRNDASWGAILSKPLYHAQKELGALYRQELARNLIKLGYKVHCQNETIQLDGIGRNVELSFSKRRADILQAVQKFQLVSPKQLEKAALRTRQSKQKVSLEALLRAWQSRAHQMNIDMQRPDLLPVEQRDLDKTQRLEFATVRLRKLAKNLTTPRSLNETLKLLRSSLNSLKGILSRLPKASLRPSQLSLKKAHTMKSASYILKTKLHF